jgi:hypothetical protein
MLIKIKLLPNIFHEKLFERKFKFVLNFSYAPKLIKHIACLYNDSHSLASEPSVFIMKFVLTAIINESTDLSETIYCVIN